MYFLFSHIEVYVVLGGAVFDKRKSPLELHISKLREFVRKLQTRIANEVEVIAVSECGSFSLCEAVPDSDVNLRVYAWSRKGYFWNEVFYPPIEKLDSMRQIMNALPCGSSPPIPVFHYCRDDFNEGVAEEISDEIGIRTNFVLVDTRVVDYDVFRIDRFPSDEYLYLLQGSILFDPKKWLRDLVVQLEDVRFDSIADLFYSKYLKQVDPMFYELLEMTRDDLDWVSRNNKIPWVSCAVEIIRNAAMAFHYAKTGEMIFKKGDIIDFYQQFLPDRISFIKFLYTLKTDVKNRTSLIRSLILSPQDAISYFWTLVGQVENVVDSLRNKF